MSKVIVAILFSSCVAQAQLCVELFQPLLSASQIRSLFSREVSPKTYLKFSRELARSVEPISLFTGEIGSTPELDRLSNLEILRLIVEASKQTRADNLHWRTYERLVVYFALQRGRLAPREILALEKSIGLRRLIRKVDYMNRESDIFPDSDYGNLVVDAVLGLPTAQASLAEQADVRRRIKIEDENKSHTWWGLSPLSLNTPYHKIYQQIRALDLPAGTTVVDMGSGFGRMGMVIGLAFPHLKFVGYEFWQSRLEHGEATARLMSWDNVNFEHADFAAKDFRPIDGDVFFVYWSNSNERVMEKMYAKIKVIAERKPILFMGRSTGTPPLGDRVTYQSGPADRQYGFEVIRIHPLPSRARR